MPALSYDLEVEQGSSYDLHIDWVYPDPSGVERPVPMAGCTAIMQIRNTMAADRPGSVVFVTLTDGAGITLDPASGAIDVHMTAIQTATLTTAPMWFDLHVQWPDANGVVVDAVRLIEGRVFVDPSVTDVTP